MTRLFQAAHPIIITISMLVTTWSLSNDINSGESPYRERRALVFPTGTVLQLTVGLSMPMSAPNRTLAISFGIQMVYSMPTNATQWHSAAEIMGRRAIASTALADIYVPIETFLEDHGFDGRMCLLRSICEAAHSPFRHEDLNLLEEIMHAILTPSQEVAPAEADCRDNTQVMDYLPLQKQYLAAECVGKSGGDCDAAYPDCPESPLDYISQTVQLEIFPE